LFSFFSIAATGYLLGNKGCRVSRHSRQVKLQIAVVRLL